MFLMNRVSTGRNDGASALVFCKIVSGEIPANIIYKSESVLAFLDVAPLADGHLLVIPTEHCKSLLDIAPSALAEVARSLPVIGQALVDVTGATGFNVLQNNGAVAGQVVEHFHVHLIPRVEGDSLGFRWNAGAYAETRAAELADAFRDCLPRSE